MLLYDPNDPRLLKILADRFHRRPQLPREFLPDASRYLAPRSARPAARAAIPNLQPRVAAADATSARGPAPTRRQRAQVANLTPAALREADRFAIRERGRNNRDLAETAAGMTGVGYAAVEAKHALEGVPSLLGMGMAALPLAGPIKKAVLKALPIEELLQRASGFTFDPRLGRFIEGEGFAVANPPGNVAHVLDDVTPAALRKVVRDNRALLERPGMMLGGWKDPATGKTYIEVSQVVPDRETALQLARSRNEKAVFDLKNLEDVANPHYTEGATGNIAPLNPEPAAPAGGVFDSVAGKWVTPQSEAAAKRSDPIKAAAVRAETAAATEEPERIVEASIRTKDGKYHTGNSHGEAYEAAGEPEGGYERLFKTSRGRHVDPQEAYEIQTGVKGGSEHLSHYDIEAPPPAAPAVHTGQRGGLLNPEPAAPAIVIPKGNRRKPLGAAAALRDPPAVVKARAAAARQSLLNPVEPWAPTPRGLLDRSLIVPDDLATAGPAVLPHARAEAATPRASLGHLKGLDSPENIDLVMQQIRRGLPLGAETFYPSFKSVEAAIAEHGGDPTLFRNATSAGSIRNSLPNELASGTALQFALKRGIISPEIIDEAMKAGTLEELAKTVRGEVAKAFPEAPGLPMLPNQLSAFHALQAGAEPLSYKVPTYNWQKGGGKFGWVADTHEATGTTLASPFHRYFAGNGGLSDIEYGPVEGLLSNVATGMGLTPRTAQAARWMGGGELTGLKSAMGDYAQHFEDSILWNARERGLDPKSLLGGVAKGDNILYPYYKKGRLPIY